VRNLEIRPFFCLFLLHEVKASSGCNRKHEPTTNEMISMVMEHDLVQLLKQEESMRSDLEHYGSLEGKRSIISTR
jgi:hypothetical protein